MRGTARSGCADGSVLFSGGGQQRWWDPAWRAQRLSELGEGGNRKYIEVDTVALTARFSALRASGGGEVQLRENYGPHGARQVESLAAAAGLHFKRYGRGTNTVLVTSTEPLPNYRPELDARHGTRQAEVALDDAEAARLEAALRRVGGAGAGGDSSTGSSDGGRTGGSGQYLPPHARREQEAAAVPDSWDDVPMADVLDAAPVDGGAPTQASARMRQRQLEHAHSPAAERMKEFRQKLPAFGARERLLAAVASNQVVVVSGETGCGKTTQLPQFLLEDAIARGRGAEASIVCTQPRRIAAISVAQRVAEERGERLGESVGYQVRLESERSEDTRLLFCTTGVLLRKMAGDRDLRSVTTVIVDEIHERGMYEDFLLVVLRDLLPRRPDLRVVLMSATLNAESFSEYFGGCPTMHIPGYTFPVDVHYLEDVLEATGHTIQPADSWGRGKAKPMAAAGDVDDISAPDYASPEYTTKYSAETVRSLQAWTGDELDVDLVVRALEHVHTSEGHGGAVLVFLTGWDEITKVLDAARASPVLRSCQLLPLHGSLPSAQQQQIFRRPPPGVRKVVLSTNIAETSITIDDVVYVLDCGKIKMTSYDALNKLEVMKPEWVSKAGAHQRRGRAGRVQSGVCLRLYPRHTHDGFMEHTPPELLRTPLEGLILQIKALGLPCAASFLARSLEPPDERAVANALSLLEEIGAIETADADEGERLTALGRHLAALPCDPRVGKMLVIGACLGQADVACAIAASLAYRDPFVLPIDKKGAADAARARMAAGTVSDHVALLNALVGYREARYGGGRGAAERFARENFLSGKTLSMIDSMAAQFMGVLQQIGFVGGRRSLTIRRLDARSEQLPIIRAVIASGLFPSVAAVSGRTRPKFHTREDGSVVQPHPSSICSRTDAVDFSSKWLVYGEKMHTAKIYLRDSTMVSDLTLLLLGGNVEVSEGDVITEQGPETSFSMLDKYVNFTCDARSAHLVSAVRAKLDELLAAKVADARLDIGSSGHALVGAISELLRAESARANREATGAREALELRRAQKYARREERQSRGGGRGRGRGRGRADSW